MSERNEQKQENNVPSRREFFTWHFSSLRSALSSPDLEKQIPGRILLSSLEDIPEAVLMPMVPVLHQGWSVTLCESGVSYRDPVGQEDMVYLSPEGCAAAQLFDGVLTMEKVAQALEDQFGKPPGSGATIVREAFLALAMQEVYHPKEELPDPIQEDRPEEE